MSEEIDWVTHSKCVLCTRVLPRDQIHRWTEPETDSRGFIRQYMACDDCAEAIGAKV